MNESVEKFSEQSVVKRALVIRAKMALEDLYKKHICCTEEYKNLLVTQEIEATFWDDFSDWDDVP